MRRRREARGLSNQYADAARDARTLVLAAKAASPGMGLRAIAAQTGVSKSRVAQILRAEGMGKPVTAPKASPRR